ncbi:hypothetical protein OJ996_20485 [Luteolibacter sp. GHJ8]|uniref:Uncharacterized protein n=1 Tax=Luteolibacter rhizosphaerae TaxID=2989719 RepID=A0ABT3G8M1_9BACT|nr:hypothetical protein [Luteolibacter rhizosphaerae]MCW1915977.1 hypothetical protein [Luteolibacter rhizosphaerae]
MIILFIPGFAASIQPRPRATPLPDPAPEKVTSGSDVLPNTAPYTVNQTNLIYSASVSLAAAMEDARGIEKNEHPLWLIEAINGRALHFGRSHGHPCELVIEALRVIEASVRENPLRSKDKISASWRLADAEFVERALPIVFLLADTAIGRGPQPQPGAVGEGSMDVGQEIEFPEGQLALLRDGWLHLKSGPSSYDIELTRIPNAEALLGWIDHLGGKTWVTSQHLHQLVRSVAGSRGWRLHPVPSGTTT